MLTQTLVLVIKIRAGHRQKFDIKIHCGIWIVKLKPGQACFCCES